MSKSDTRSGGIVLIDKPQDWTSFDVVSKVRRLLGIRKVGHIGTLDPFAVGLLPVCVGRATRMVRFMDQYDKVYRVTVVFGRSTDTLDLTGKTVCEHVLTPDERSELIKTDFQALRDAVGSLTQLTAQKPPLYSAVKINGRRLYEYARSGQIIDRPERPIRIDSATLESVSLTDSLQATVTIHCSKGTYIRSLCDHLGQMLGWGAHAKELQRISCGPYQLCDAQTLDQLNEITQGLTDPQERLAVLRAEKRLLPLESALIDYPAYDLSESDAVRLIHGQPVSIHGRAADGSKRVAFFHDRQLVAVGRIEWESLEQGRIRTERVLIDFADLYRRETENTP